MAITPVWVDLTASKIFGSVRIGLLPVILSYEPTISSKVSNVNGQANEVVNYNRSGNFAFKNVTARVRRMLMFSICFLFCSAEHPYVSIKPFRLINSWVGRSAFIAPIYRIFKARGHRVVATPAQYTINHKMSMVFLNLVKVWGFQINVRLKRGEVTNLMILYHRILDGSHSAGRDRNGGYFFRVRFVVN